MALGNLTVPVSSPGVGIMLNGALDLMFDLTPAASLRQGFPAYARVTMVVAGVDRYSYTAPITLKTYDTVTEVSTAGAHVSLSGYFANTSTGTLPISVRTEIFGITTGELRDAGANNGVSGNLWVTKTF
ncbi:hypothetical protein D3C72_895910 [compost metagenome]